MAKRRVVIIGGGLAGMVVAKELLQRDVPVVLLEASSRLGGKAGADHVNGVYEEHGYHVFPGWYVNVRELLRELGLSDNLIDIERFYHLRKGEFPNLISYYPMNSMQNMVRNVSSGLLSWPETLVSFYSGMDLASQSFNLRAFLDLVSSNGFLHSRFYATEAIATLHQQTALQASAIPNYEISAMTTQKLLRLWFRTPTPILSILNGNLHEKFIAPIEHHLRRYDADIRFDRRVQRLEMRRGRVSGLTFDDGTRLEKSGPDDVFVLATPHEVTVQFVDEEVYAAEDQGDDEDEDAPKRLSDLVHLRSAPMAALHLYLNRRVPQMPKEHVNLYQSRYGISFVDVSQHWTGLPNTTLSMISANFASLETLGDDAAEYLIGELQEYIPQIRSRDVARHYIQPNVKFPLFLNTVRAWHYRPATRTRIANLYTAGDYCRSEADITTMESAVISALSTARDIIKTEGWGTHRGPLPLDLPPRALLVLLKYLGLPLITPFGLYFWLRRQIEELAQEERSL